MATASPPSFYDDIHPDWQAVLDPSLFAMPDLMYKKAREEGKSVLPAREDVMNVFKRPPSHYSVVIVGQDPYPTAGDANGYAFSYTGGGRTPKSLKNITTIMRSTLKPEVGYWRPDDLSDLADAGVLLLNTILTVHEGAAKSCKGWSWQDITADALRTMVDETTKRPVAFLCWGRDAQSAVQTAMETTVVHTERFLRLDCSHPSPLGFSARVNPFRDMNHFRQVNEWLVEKRVTPIPWFRPPLSD